MPTNSTYQHMHPTKFYILARSQKNLHCGTQPQNLHINACYIFHKSLLLFVSRSLLAAAFCRLVDKPFLVLREHVSAWSKNASCGDLNRVLLLFGRTGADAARDVVIQIQEGARVPRINCHCVGKIYAGGCKKRIEEHVHRLIQPRVVIHWHFASVHFADCNKTVVRSSKKQHNLSQNGYGKV